VKLSTEYEHCAGRRVWPALELELEMQKVLRGVVVLVVQRTSSGMRGGDEDGYGWPRLGRACGPR